MSEENTYRFGESDGHSSQVVAHTQLKTCRKGSPLDEQSLVMHTVSTHSIVFQLKMTVKKKQEDKGRKKVNKMEIHKWFCRNC